MHETKTKFNRNPLFGISLNKIYFPDVLNVRREYLTRSNRTTYYANDRDNFKFLR